MSYKRIETLKCDGCFKTRELELSSYGFPRSHAPGWAVLRVEPDDDEDLIRYDFCPECAKALRLNGAALVA